MLLLSSRMYNIYRTLGSGILSTPIALSVEDSAAHPCLAIDASWCIHSEFQSLLIAYEANKLVTIA